MVIVSFLLFLLLFIVIGLSSSWKSKSSTKDYLLAGQNIPPWMAGLSAVATNSSGYMFIGMIGYTYKNGLSSIWLMIGWILGDFVTSLYVHKRLRETTEKRHSLSFGGALANWTGKEYILLRRIIGVITILFLGTYAAAQFNAGSKALHVLFGWNYEVGAILGCIIVVLYCFAGGIRASIWTDVAQAFVMILAMFFLTIFSVSNLGGIQSFITQLQTVSPDYMNLFTDELKSQGVWAPILFVIGWFFGGVAIIGQPHIMVRFMALDQAAHMNQAKFWYYGWYILFYGLTIIVGLATRLILKVSENFDAELALPMLANTLLPEVFVGLVLAGLFSAIMSTADSQIISCTAALTTDLKLKEKFSYRLTKLGTILIALAALFIALYGEKSVFKLVLVSWSALASCFGALIIVLTFGEKPSEKLSILMLATGLITMLLWRSAGWSSWLYEAAPGILAGFIPYLFSKIIFKKTL